MAEERWFIIMKMFMTANSKVIRLMAMVYIPRRAERYMRVTGIRTNQMEKVNKG